MKKGIDIFLVVLLICLIGGLGFFTFKLFENNDKVLVPDFSDKTRTEIVAWCNSLEINPCSFDNDYSDTIEKDKLIYQSISAEQELGDSISFIISLGKKLDINFPIIDENTTKDTVDKWITNNKITNKIEYIEEYNDKVNKTCVIRFEPLSVTSPDDVIKVYISKGPEIEKTEVTGDIVVEAGSYIGLTEDEFKTKAKQLKLSANHNVDRDAYSSTIEKGKIVWHGSGSYVENETFNYGLSLGKSDSVIEIKKGDYVGKTLEEFEKIVKEFGLIPEHYDNEYYFDEYSDTIEKGKLDWHGSGTYEKGEVIHYTLSLGKENDTVKKEKPVTFEQDQFTGKTFSEFKSIVNQYDLEPVHNSDWDKYSDTIAKGNIIRHGYGTYYKDETTIRYGLSLGPETTTEKVSVASGHTSDTETNFRTYISGLGLLPNNGGTQYSDSVSKNGIIYQTGSFAKGSSYTYYISLGKDTRVSVNSHAGESESTFLSFLSNKGLKAGTKTEEESSSYRKGVIISNTTGTFDSGSPINYKVSLGLKINNFDTIAAVEQTSYDATCSAIRTALEGFTNITFKGEAGESVGKLLSISVNGQTGNLPGYFDYDVAIVVTVCNAQLN